MKSFVCSRMFCMHFVPFFCSMVYFIYIKNACIRGKKIDNLLCLLCQFGHSAATLKGSSTRSNPSNFDRVASKNSSELYSFTACLIGGIVTETETILLRWQSSCQGYWDIRQSGGVHLAEGWKESKSKCFMFWCQNPLFPLCIVWVRVTFGLNDDYFCT